MLKQIKKKINQAGVQILKFLGGYLIIINAFHGYKKYINNQTIYTNVTPLNYLENKNLSVCFSLYEKPTNKIIIVSDETMDCITRETLGQPYFNEDPIIQRVSFLGDIISNLLIALFLLIGLLIAVAYYTLLERKVMAAMQRRKGPNVVGIWGLLQPLADGLKLILKEIIIPVSANQILFVLAPILTFIVSFVPWVFIPFSPDVILSDVNLSSLFVMAISSIGVYGVIIAGWASNSKYAFLGGLRSAAQMISYEIALGFILVFIVLITGSFNFIDIVEYQIRNVWLCFPLLPLVWIFYCSMLAETNRAPYDLPEAEAELVSGYNTEYSSITFALFFLAEYSSMLMMSTLFVIYFLGGWDYIYLPIKVVLVAFTFIWVRATLPRYRYDQLMSIGWKIFLPFTLGFLFFIIAIFYVTNTFVYNGYLINYFI